MRRSLSALLIAAILSASCGGAATPSRVSRIRQRGFLVCGVSPGIAGFDEVDRQGNYAGFDIDICRAVAAAIVGSAARIRYQPIESIDVFQRSTDIDIVSRRLTWTLRREGTTRAVRSDHVLRRSGISRSSASPRRSRRGSDRRPVCVRPDRNTTSR
jgi:general L-amino acid transport system substrate-binding protein